MRKGKNGKTRCTFNWGVSRAKKEGYRIIEPKPNELQIDIDGSAELSVFRQQWSVFERAGICSAWKHVITPSKKLGRFHVSVFLPKPITNFQRVCFQAILGSDIRREAFNLCRVLNGNKYPIAFFERDK